ATRRLRPTTARRRLSTTPTPTATTTGTRPSITIRRSSASTAASIRAGTGGVPSTRAAGAGDGPATTTADTAAAFTAAGFTADTAGDFTAAAPAGGGTAVIASISYSPRLPRLPFELTIVFVDDTVTFRSFRFAENVISMKLRFVSADLNAKGLGFNRREIAA